MVAFAEERTWTASEEGGEGVAQVRFVVISAEALLQRKLCPYLEALTSPRSGHPRLQQGWLALMEVEEVAVGQRRRLRVLSPPQKQRQ